LKLGWFSRLKASTRNCRLVDSRKAHSFCKDVSRSTKLGPMTSFRRAVPNVNTAGREKDVVLNHCLAVLGPALGSPVTLGRSRLLPLMRPMFATSFEAPRFTVNGAPLCAVKIPPARHPAAAARTQ